MTGRGAPLPRFEQAQRHPHVSAAAGAFIGIGPAAEPNAAGGAPGFRPAGGWGRIGLPLHGALSLTGTGFVEPPDV